jgi:hypothetical protein
MRLRSALSQAIVRTRREAQLAVDFLLSLPPTTVFACDTETTGIDPKVTMMSRAGLGYVGRGLDDGQRPSAATWVPPIQSKSQTLNPDSEPQTPNPKPQVESPVGSGRVVCLSVYAGDKVDFNLIGGGKLRTELGTDPAEAVSIRKT